MTPLLEARALALAGRLEPTALSVGLPELVALVGPNGGGKTSLLHALAGIGGPAGEVRLAGVDPRLAPPPARRRLLGFLPAAREAAWPVTARDLVTLGGGDASAVADDLELWPLLDRRVDRLSTGERSRVLIARVLAQRPRLLLLDEPVANLDPYWQLRMMEIIRREVAQGRAALVAMHDLDLAARFADRLLLVGGGRIVADGEPAALLDGPAVPAAFGIERGPDGAWRPLSRRADRRSSP